MGTVEAREESGHCFTLGNTKATLGCPEDTQVYAATSVFWYSAPSWGTVVTLEMLRLLYMSIGRKEEDILL